MIRTAAAAEAVVERMVENQLARVEDDPNAVRVFSMYTNAPFFFARIFGIRQFDIQRIGSRQ